MLTTFYERDDVWRWVLSERLGLERERKEERKRRKKKCGFQHSGLPSPSPSPLLWRVLAFLLFGCFDRRATSFFYGLHDFTYLYVSSTSREAPSDLPPVLTFQLTSSWLYSNSILTMSRMMMKLPYGLSRIQIFFFVRVTSPRFFIPLFVRSVQPIHSVGFTMTATGWLFEDFFYPFRYCLFRSAMI